MSKQGTLEIQGLKYRELNKAQVDRNWRWTRYNNQINRLIKQGAGEHNGEAHGTGNQELHRKNTRSRDNTGSEHKQGKTRKYTGGVDTRCKHKHMVDTGNTADRTQVNLETKQDVKSKTWIQNHSVSVMPHLTSQLKLIKPWNSTMQSSWLMGFWPVLRNSSLIYCI